MTYWKFRSSVFSLAMITVVFVCGTFNGIASESSTTSTGWSLPSIQVVDEAGAPVADAEAVMVRDNDSRIGFYMKRTDGSGSTTLTNEDYYFPAVKKVPEGTYDVMVRAQGFAPGFAKWPQPTSSSLTVKLKPGRAIDLIVKSDDGREIPRDLVPMVYPREFGVYVQAKDNEKYANTSVWPERTGAGKYRIVLNESTTRPLSVSIQDPDFLTGFSAAIETTSALISGIAEIHLPKPESVKINVAVPDNLKAAARGKSLTVRLLKLVDLGDSERMYVGVGGGKSELTASGLHYIVDNIAPGKYYAEVTEASIEELRNSPASHAPKFRDGKSFEVAAGTSAELNFTFKQFDPTSLSGNGVAHVTVRTQKGTPAAGLDVRLKTYLSEFGTYFTVTTGTLDSNGAIIFDDLAAGDKDVPSFDLTEDAQYADTIGRIALSSGKTSGTYDFTIPPTKGDMAPDITLYDVNTSKPVTLSSLRGKVVFLDFWATWCGPCQAPMAHNQKVLEENGARWDDKVAIIGASIDEDAKTVVEYVKKNGWEAVQHLWCGDGDFKSKPGEIYGVDSVPTAFLINKNGKIVWRGHPDGFLLVEEIDTLLGR